MRSASRWAFAVIAAAVLAVAAAPAMAHSHRRPKSAHVTKKTKKKAPVLVRCAGVTVTCHTHAGPAGPQGPVGVAGPQGAPGASGAAGQGIAYRIRSTGTVVSSNSKPTAIPLSPAAFQQPADSDERLLGTMTVRFPTGDCAENSKKETEDIGSFEADVTLDGEVVGIAVLEAEPYKPRSVHTIPIVWTGGVEDNYEDLGDTLSLPLEAPASQHLLAVEVGDDCSLSGASHFAVEGVAIDVLSAG